ncbi:MAG: helix-turn-helix domain-containing protein [Archaeoglobaceae archaeon]|nr:helix-turn-helix domain-containing protein [Archaeoglobaceae archaeon]MCX8151600.1 helix-turn-helix domain-containing protein [Archaeoglobaceae archaeon]MDW8013122.1 helix-turn-helix domain-containing protein [Archaeoglobaceae archaeon]
MLKVEIRTRVSDECILKKLKPLTEISVEGLLSKENLVKCLLKLKADDIDEVLKNLPEFCEWSKVGRCSLRILLKEHPCSIVLTLLKAGGMVTKIRIDNDKIVLSLICNDDCFLEILRALDNSRIDYEVVYKGKLESEREITFREEEILKIALEKGFFDYPKRIKLEDLANELEISPSTLSEIVRRGLKKILQKYFY